MAKTNIDLPLPADNPFLPVPLVFLSELISEAHNGGANIAFWDGHVSWMNVNNVPRGRRGNGIKFVAEDPVAP